MLQKQAQWQKLRHGVVNRFQNFVSLHASKTGRGNEIGAFMLWIAFKILYLCMLQKRLSLPHRWHFVVNRFQNFVSLHASKTLVLLRLSLLLLWIAFKILYLCMLQKPTWQVLTKHSVVNRFQNFVSLHASKTRNIDARPDRKLWIAFKILYLCMLQKHYWHGYNSSRVVNRFQNFVSLHASKTTSGWWILPSVLWIAFKILYLCMLQKHFQPSKLVRNSCESLSKFCIFACFKNENAHSIIRNIVVNRFQNFVSLHASKTITDAMKMEGKLWIAFKILYLCMLQKPTR